MDKAVLGARYFMGAIFVVFGLNGFFQFIPQPPIPEEAMAFLGGMMAAPYFFPLLKITEIVCGALLLANKYVALALVILAPICLQILLFHLFLAPDPMGLGMAVLLVVAGVLQTKKHWSKYQGLFN